MLLAKTVQEKVYDAIALAVGHAGLAAVGGEGTAEATQRQESVFFNPLFDVGQRFLIGRTLGIYGQTFFQPGRPAPAEATPGETGQDQVGQFVAHRFSPPSLNLRRGNPDQNRIVCAEGEAAGPLLRIEYGFPHVGRVFINIEGDFILQGDAHFFLQASAPGKGRVEQERPHLLPFVPVEGNILCADRLPGEALILKG